MLDSFYITILNDVSDLFILDAYFNRSPAARVDFCFSDPAKSTKCNLEDLIDYPSEFNFFYFVLIYNVNIECERDDYLFIFV